MLIKKVYHLAIVAPVGKLCCNMKNGVESHDVDCQGKGGKLGQTSTDFQVK